jgi:predicted dehydrogenase
MSVPVIRFGLIGTNFVTDWIIRGGRQSPNFEVTALYSRTQETASAFAAKHAIPHTFTSLEAMFSSPLIDAVYIASPNSCHYAQALLAASYKKHILCEKPLAATAREARAMVKAARENGVVLLEAMRTTLTPNFYVLQENLHRVGRLRRFFSSYCQYSSRYDQVLQGGEIANVFKPEFAGGAMLDIGVYTIYPMVVLFGKPQKLTVEAVKVPTGVDGQAVVTFSYDGFNATVLYSKITDSYLPTEVQGELGNIVVDRIHRLAKVTFIGRATGRKEEELAVVHEKDEFYYQVQEFCDLVLGKKAASVNNSVENSVIVMELLDEIRRQIGLVYPADSADIPE